MTGRIATAHGWSHLFTDEYSHGGGPDTYAAYLVNTAGYEGGTRRRRGLLKFIIHRS